MVSNHHRQKYMSCEQKLYTPNQKFGQGLPACLRWQCDAGQSREAKPRIRRATWHCGSGDCQPHRLFNGSRQKGAAQETALQFRRAQETIQVRAGCRKGWNIKRGSGVGVPTKTNWGLKISTMDHEDFSLDVIYFTQNVEFGFVSKWRNLPSFYAA